MPYLSFSNEYQIFQKIIKLEYEFPEGFPDSPKDLVEKLLVSQLFLFPRIQVNLDILTAV